MKKFTRNPFGFAYSEAAHRRSRKDREQVTDREFDRALAELIALEKRAGPQQLGPQWWRKTKETARETAP